MKLATLALGVGACALVVVAGHLLVATTKPARAAYISPPKRDARVLTEVARMVRAERQPTLEPVDVADALDPASDVEPVEPVEPRDQREVRVQGAIDRGLGAIYGQVRDQRTGETLAGVTVVATPAGGRPALASISDEDGYYDILDLAPDSYVVTFYYIETVVERSGIEVMRTSVYIPQKLPSQPHRNFAIEIEGSPPPIDFATANHGVGISISGTTSIDNVYIVEEPESSL